MAHINLLPWREELRKQRQREFATIAGGSAMAMVLVVVYVHMHINGMIEAQEGRNTYLRNEITQVEKKIKEIEDLEKQKQQLIARMRIIEQLQRNRPEIVRRFDELVRLVPKGLYMNSLSQKGDTLTFEGVAQSNARVSAFMRNLDDSASFERPSLEFIETSASKSQVGKSRKFRLSVKQVSAQKE